MRRIARLLLLLTSLSFVEVQASAKSLSVVDVAQKALPGVVSIQSSRKSGPSVGSGVILRQDGLIVTSFHVIEGAEKIGISLLGETKVYPARLIAGDGPTDVALLQLETSSEFPQLPQLSPLKLGDSDRAKVGDSVIAVGNPFGFRHSVTSGIISARGRNGSAIGAMTGSPGENGPEVEDLIQTDAAINPGNSGGPLLNSQGEMIGLNAAIFSQNGGFIGIGFAIPARVVKEISDELIKSGKISRGWIGVTAQNLDDELASLLHTKGKDGALISEIRTDGPARKSDLRPGDILVQFDGTPIRDSIHLKQIVARTPAGKKVRIQMLRDGKSETCEIIVQEKTRPDTGSTSTEESSEKSLPPSKKTQDLGLTLQNVPGDLRSLLELPAKEGVLISQVSPGSRAARAGLNTGDVILSLHLTPTDSADALQRAIDSKLGTKKPGPLLLLLQRGPGDRIFVALPVS